MSPEETARLRLHALELYRQVKKDALAEAALTPTDAHTVMTPAADVQPSAVPPCSCDIE